MSDLCQGSQDVEWHEAEIFMLVTAKHFSLSPIIQGFLTCLLIQKLSWIRMQLMS